MSSISSTGQGLFQYFQQISGNNSTSQPASTPTVSSTDGTTTTTDPSAATSTGAVHHGHHHHGGGGGGGKSGLMQQIQSAVTSALQSAKTDGSSDPNQIVEDAITKVLKNAGNGAGGTSATGTSGTASATDPDGDGDNDAGAGATSASSSAKDSFFQALQSVGIDPQQFHSDFAAAVKQVQAGGDASDASTAFQNFPPGVMVDTMG
jgi:hypothetical protein